MTATTTRLLTALAASAITLAGLAPTPVFAGTFATNQHEFIHRRAGRTTPEARSVGQITGGWAETGGFIARGSGVLIGGRYVLTAAHLVDDMTSSGTFTIRGQNYGMQRWVVSNRFYDRIGSVNPTDRVFGRGGDLALVQLDRRVVGARTIRAKMNTRRNENGKTATIVGFGRGGDGAVGINTPAPGTGALIPATPIPNDSNGSFGTDDGTVWNFQPVKRAGKNVIEALSPFARRTSRELVTDFDAAPDQLSTLADAGLQPPQFDPFTGTYNVDEDDIPISNEFAPSVGDSGGGLFINGKLAGITSWTTRANSEFFSQANYTRLSRGGWRWARDNIRAFNHFLANPNPEPWRTVAKGGSGFRGVAQIKYTADFDTTGDGDNDILEGDTFNIFGPGLFFDLDPITGVRTHFSVAMDVSNRFIFNDLNADPAPLPEPTSLALLTLGGLTILRRRHR